MNITERAALVLQEIDETLASFKDVTPGPWGSFMKPHCAGQEVTNGQWSGGGETIADCGWVGKSVPIANFIARSRTGWPKALEMLKGAIEGLLKIITLANRFGVVDGEYKEQSKISLTTLCDQWEASRK